MKIRLLIFMSICSNYLPKLGRIHAVPYTSSKLYLKNSVDFNPYDERKSFASKKPDSSFESCSLNTPSSSKSK